MSNTRPVRVYSTEVIFDPSAIMTIKRKLAALGYQQDFNLQDNKKVAQLILWVENNKIKHYNNPNRNPLQNINSNEWMRTFDTYLKALKCPVPVEKLEACIDWCLGHAIQIEYSKQKDVFNKYAVNKLESTTTPNVIADNPLDHLDFSSKEFRDGINNLANILKIPPHPNQLVVLEACSKVIQRRLHTQALENPNDYIMKGTPYPFKVTDLGFEMNDDCLNEMAKVLRLLYIQDLRNLQTKANECIVAVQSVTANPKTDTKLGKVGK